MEFKKTLTVQSYHIVSLGNIIPENLNFMGSGIPGSDDESRTVR